MGTAIAYSAPAGTSSEYACAAANDDDECEDGNERPVGVAISLGRSSTAGRCLPIATLIEVESR